MKFPTRRIAAAALLAGLGLAASAQTAPPAPPAAPGAPMMQRGPGGPGMDRMHEHMQQRVAQRMNRLKEALRITPQQEGAWTAWTNSMRPAQRPQRPDIGEIARMTTPERIDRMKQVRAQRIAEQDRRGEATKAFYNALNADQKRVFDQLTLQRFGGHGGMRGHGHGGMHGERGGWGGGPR